jgi:hypothetical protein
MRVTLVLVSSNLYEDSYKSQTETETGGPSLHGGYTTTE